MSSMLHSHINLTESSVAIASQTWFSKTPVSFEEAALDFVTGHMTLLGVTGGAINVGVWTSFDGGKTFHEWFRSADVAAASTPASFTFCQHSGDGTPVNRGRWVDTILGSLTGTPNLTFADANPDTITRSAGDFAADGFVAGQILDISGSASNDGTWALRTHRRIASVATTVLTLFPDETLTAETLNTAPNGTLVSRAAPSPQLSKGTTAPGLIGNMFLLSFETAASVSTAATQTVQIEAQRT